MFQRLAFPFQRPIFDRLVSFMFLFTFFEMSNHITFCERKVTYVYRLTFLKQSLMKIFTMQSEYTQQIYQHEHSLGNEP